MIDLSPAQAVSRITALLAAAESRTLDFNRFILCGVGGDG